MLGEVRLLVMIIDTGPVSFGGARDNCFVHPSHSVETFSRLDYFIKFSSASILLLPMCFASSVIPVYKSD